MNPSEDIQNLLAPLLAELGNTAQLVEIALLLGLAALAWLLTSRLRRRFGGSEGERTILAAEDWSHLVFPLVLLPGLLIGRAVLTHWQDVHLLNLAMPLLLSLLAMQAVFFLLRRILRPGSALQTVQRLIFWLVWGLLALHITGYLREVVATLEAIGLSVGKQRISLYDVLTAAVSVSLAVMLALWLARTVESRLEALPLHANMRLALAKLARGLLLVLAVLVALPLVGIDITVLSVFGGALGVGLGLGLQKIAANYVSGFTLLLDQSIRIGDMVTVGDRYGEVTQIATRYTVIRGLDGTETILPNESLITTAVTNHSLSTPDNLVGIPVQVAYASDLRRVEAILLEVANRHERVMKTHAPSVRLTGFGESGVDLRLVVWIMDPEEGQATLVSDLNWGIWDAFRREGIEIPYPQRVVHVRQDPGVAATAVTKA